MTLRKLELPQNVPSFSQRVELDGAEFVLTFDWIGRSGSWALSIADAEEEEIVSGIAVRLGWPLLGRFVGSRLPRGELFAIDTTGSGVEPGLGDLGARVALVYVEAEDFVP